MANIPIRDIPGAVVASPDPSNLIPMDNGAIMQKTTIANSVNAALPLSSQAEAEVGADNAKRMSPLRTKQAIDAQVPGIIGGAISALNLGTMSQETASDYTKTSGLAAVALSNEYGDLSNLPTLGTAASTNASDYATAAQGTLASTAIQPGAPALVPAGGAAGQVLAKNSGTNYDAGWISSAAATAVSYVAQTLTSAQQLQARTNISALGPSETPDRAFRQGNILGVVSQSAGVPTGAIVERGSNANGEYVRFADGTQICWEQSGILITSSTAVGAIFASVSYNFTFSAAFVGGNPVVYSGPLLGSGSAPWGVITSVSITGASAVSLSAVTGATGYPSVIAIGRWF